MLSGKNRDIPIVANAQNLRRGTDRR